VVLFTLICSLVIHNIQNKKVRLLLTRKEGEVKKSALLNQINLSGKTIELYRDAFRPRDVFLVMGAVGDTAKSSGVKMVSIKPGEEEDKPLYYRQYFNMQLEAASYHAIGKFVSELESSKDTYFIDELEIKIKEKSPASGSAAAVDAKPVSDFTVNMILSIVVFRG